MTGPLRSKSLWLSSKLGLINVLLTLREMGFWKCIYSWIFGGQFDLLVPRVPCFINDNLVDFEDEMGATALDLETFNWPWKAGSMVNIF